MKLKFLHRADNDTLILFFNGWGMSDELVGNLKYGRYDVVVASDYTAGVHLLPELCIAYKRIHLVAWSLGVWAAASAFEYTDIPLQSALAINGTLRPISADFGIAPAIFAGTIANWPIENARERFQLRMVGNREHLPEIMAHTKRSYQEQQLELEALSNRIQGTPEPANLFTRAVISSHDRIFPTSAQLAFWSQTQTSVCGIEGPHYPFIGLSSWAEVLRLGEH